MINYTIGDATYPEGDGFKLIVHVCNDIGKWGKGFVLAISKRWSKPKERYLDSPKGPPYKLGLLQFVDVDKDLMVVNMIAQKGIYPNKKQRPPIRYKALRKCLAGVAIFAKKQKASVHMPRIGAGLAGGNWDKIEKIIDEELEGVEVTVYDLPE